MRSLALAFTILWPTIGFSAPLFHVVGEYDRIADSPLRLPYLGEYTRFEDFESGGGLSRIDETGQDYAVGPVPGVSFSGGYPNFEQGILGLNSRPGPSVEGGDRGRSVGFTAQPWPWSLVPAIARYDPVTGEPITLVIRQYDAYLELEFLAEELGFLPTRAGFAWMESLERVDLTLTAIGVDGESLGSVSFAGDGTNQFVGVTDTGGIAALHAEFSSRTSEGPFSFRIDHLQFGMTPEEAAASIPEPSSVLLAAAAGGVLVWIRRHDARRRLTPG